MQTNRTTIESRPGGAGVVLRAALLAACTFIVGGCTTDAQLAGTPSVPTDFRMRHPITVSEADRTLELFVGVKRGSLTAMQRAQVLAFAQGWRNDATGGVIIDLPAGSRNEHAAAQTIPEIRSILGATGVPQNAVLTHRYPATDSELATVRINYPRMTAQAGPCGVWPKDIGPSLNRDYFENRPYWNFGCAVQRNLAAMVDNPADLVQPRAETPVYTARRTTVVEKYRAGADPSTQYQSGNSGKVSDLGK